MAPSIGLNLRVTGYKHQGGRRYMEDDFGVAYQQTADEKDLEYAFFGIFDGHGGREAAAFAKEHLMDYIVSQKGFWEDSDESVLKAIREGYIQTHYAMWKELANLELEPFLTKNTAPAPPKMLLLRLRNAEKWPKTASGLPSTAGTTASIAFIRRGKIYVGHVGDSAIVLGVQDPDNPDVWIADPLTIDHKPESLEESTRIIQSGGKVVCKSGVPRVVWNRPKMGHQGPVRRSTHIDEIPFLAVARSLGDLWSYNSEENVFVVSPEPDCRVYPVDITKHRCLILATDGAWNMMTPQNAVSVVCKAEKSNEQHMLNPVEGRTCWINPSKMLVDTAIERWINSKLRADNTSVVTVMLDPPGPPRAQVLKNRQRELAELNSGRDVAGPSGIQQATSADRGSMALVTNTTAADGGSLAAAAAANIEPCVPGPSGAWPSQQPQRPLSAVSDMEPVPGPSSSSLSARSSQPTPSLVPVAGSSGSALAATGTVPVPGPDSRPGESQQPPSDTCTIISRFPNSSNPCYSAGYDLFKQRKLQQDYVPDNSQDASAVAGVPVPPTRAASGVQPAVGQSPSAVRVPGTPPLPRVGGSLRDDTVILTRPSPVAAAQASSSRAAAQASRTPAADAVGSTNNGGGPAEPEDNVQCNEISSSEDSPGHSDRDGTSTPPPPPGQENILPTSSSSKITPAVDAESSKKSAKTSSSRPSVRKSLSRELNMLQAEVGRATRSTKASSPRKAVVPAAAAASPKSGTPRGVASGRVAKLSISTSVTTVSRTRTSTATYKTSPTASKTPTAAKRLAKPKLSEQKTKSLVQMRCVEIIEKLEMAKSVSTRSLSVKSLSRVDSKSTRQQAVSESPALKKANTPTASPRKPASAIKEPKTPAGKAAPVKKPKTPVTTAKTPVVSNKTTPILKAKTPAKSKAPKTPVMSTRKTRIAPAPAATPKGAKTASASVKAKTPLGLRTPKTIQKSKSVVATPARSTKKVKEIVEKLTAASNKNNITPKGKKAAISTPAKLIATTRKLTIAATPKSVGKAKAATPKTVAKSPKPTTPKSIGKSTPKSAKKIVTSNAKSLPMISRSGSSKNKIATPKTSPAKKIAATPKSAAKPASAKTVTVVATPKSSLKRKRTADATENVPEEKTMQPPAAKTPRRTAAAADVKTPRSEKPSSSKTPKSTNTKTPKKSADTKTPTKSTKSKTPSKTGGKSADTKTPRGAGTARSADAKKSPRKTPKVVVNKKPLITRSKKATVLKLKKK